MRWKPWLAAAFALLLASGAGAETVELVVDASGGTWRAGSDRRPLVDGIRRVLLDAWARLAEVEAPPDVRLRWIGAPPGVASDGCLAVDDTVGVSLGDAGGLTAAYDERLPSGHRPLIRAIHAAAATSCDRIVVVTAGLDTCGLRLSDLRVPDEIPVVLIAIEVPPSGFGEVPESLAARTVLLSGDAGLRLATALLGREPPRPDDARLVVTVDGGSEADTMIATHTISGVETELYRRRDGSFTGRVLPGPHRLSWTSGASTHELVDVQADSGAEIAAEFAVSTAVNLEPAVEIAAATAPLPVRIWGSATGPLWLVVVPADDPPDSIPGAIRVAADIHDIVVPVADIAGPAELRALAETPDGDRRLVARAPLLVRPAVASLDAPERSEISTPIEVSWDGPAAPGDRLTVAAEGSPVHDSSTCRPIDEPGIVELRTPSAPGAYEVRYLSGLSGRPLARSALEVFEILARLDGPGEVAAASVLEVAWEGPDAAGDFLTIVRPDRPEGEYGQLVGTDAGQPAMLESPDEAGEWEIRYVDGATGATFGATGLVVVPAAPSLEAPTSVSAGDRFEVRWTGPDRGGDIVAIARPGTPAHAWDDFAFTSVGSPLTLAAPFRGGSYEIRYVGGPGREVLASRPIEVR